MRGASDGLLALVVALLLALLATGSAYANKIHTVPADQATAKKALLTLADLPPIAAWKKTSSSKDDDTSCAGFNPKESDLVTTGDATIGFSAPGTVVENEVDLLSTAKMVQLDWNRTFTSRFAPCLKQMFGKALKGLEIVSARRVAAPKLGDRSTEYRLVYGATVKGKAYRGAVDFLAIMSGRTEISLVLLANLGAAAQLKVGEAGMSLVEQDLAATVVKRVQPASSTNPLTA